MQLILMLLFAMILPPKSVHEFTMKDIDGKEVSLDRYRGKVLLIVNVASKCGLTPQYADLQSFYEKYKDKGVEVLGFPANNFMGQEPGTELEIKNFCTNKFHVTFPMFAKISVKGKEMHPLYRYLTEKDQNGSVDAPVKWNFQKFLVDKNGRVLASFDPQTSVDDAQVIAAVEAALKQ
jgi:glutathione peroxidase